MGLPDHGDFNNKNPEVPNNTEFSSYIQKLHGQSLITRLKASRLYKDLRLLLLGSFLSCEYNPTSYAQKIWRQLKKLEHSNYIVLGDEKSVKADPRALDTKGLHEVAFLSELMNVPIFDWALDTLNGNGMNPMSSLTFSSGLFRTEESVFWNLLEDSVFERPEAKQMFKVERWRNQGYSILDKFYRT